MLEVEEPKLKEIKASEIAPAPPNSIAPGQDMPRPGELPPVFERHLKSCEVNDGQPVTLECEVNGVPPPEVVWLHNDRELKDSEDFKYVRAGEKFKLVIAEVFPDDFGTYTCEAYNAIGEACSSCSVIVNGKFRTVIL